MVVTFSGVQNMVVCGTKSIVQTPSLGGARSTFTALPSAAGFTTWRSVPTGGQVELPQW